MTRAMNTADTLLEYQELGAVELIQKDIQVHEKTSQSSLNDLKERRSESPNLPPPPEQVSDAGNTPIGCSDKDHGPSLSSSGTHKPSHDSILTERKTKVLVRETQEGLNSPKPTCQISSELSVIDVKSQSRETNNTFGRIRNMFEQQRDNEKSELLGSKDLGQSAREKRHKTNVSVGEDPDGKSLEPRQVKCVSQQASKHSFDQIQSAKPRTESDDSPIVQMPKMVSKQSNSKLGYRSSSHEATVELGSRKLATQTRSDGTTITNSESNCATVQSLLHVFSASSKTTNVATSQKRVRKELTSKCPSLPSGQVRKKTSSAIQRIQEQLGLQSEKVAATNHIDIPAKDHKTSSKAVKKEVIGEDESATAKEKRNFTYTDRLQVDEKPYRPWQVTSRVVTADSKNIHTPVSAQHRSGTSGQSGSPIPGLMPDSGMLERSWERRENVDGSDAACPLIAESPGVTQSLFESGYGILERPMRSNDDSLPMIELKTSEPLLAVSDGDLPSQRSECPDSVDVSATLQPQESQGQTQDRTPISFPSDDVETNRLTDFCRNNKNTATSPALPLPRPRQSAACKNFQNNHNGFWRKNRGNTYCVYTDTLDVDFVTANISGSIPPLNSTSNANQGTSPTSPMRKGEPILDMFHKKNLTNTATPRMVGSGQNQTKSKSPISNQFNKSIRRISQSYARDRRLGQTNLDVIRDNGRICLDEFDGSAKKIWVHRREKQDRTSFSSHQDDKNKVRVNSDDSRQDNRDWSRRITSGDKTKPQSGVSMPRGSLRSVLSDLSSRFRHKQQERYVKVQAIRDYAGTLPGQLSFHRGQIIKQRTQGHESSDGLSYGYFRTGALRHKQKGLFPASHVTPVGTADWSEGISPTSSMVSASVCSSR